MREIEARSVLNRTGIPGGDYAINPYLGCSHGCLYCYATFMKRFSGHTERWGTFVDVKVNAPAVLRRQLARLRRGGGRARSGGQVSLHLDGLQDSGGPAALAGAGPGAAGLAPAAVPLKVSVGTVTDAYQPLEAKYRVTRGCLEELAGCGGFRVSVLTKSELVLRDLDLFRGRPGWEVGFTLTTVSDEVSRALEPGASPPSRRLRAAQALAEAGAEVWAFVAPALPYFSDSPEGLESLFSALAASGVRRVLVDRLNPYPAARAGLLESVRLKFPQALEAVRLALREPGVYRQGLAAAAANAATKTGVELELCFSPDP